MRDSLSSSVQDRRDFWTLMKWRLVLFINEREGKTKVLGIVEILEEFDVPAEYKWGGTHILNVQCQTSCWEPWEPNLISLHLPFSGRENRAQEGQQEELLQV